MGRELGPALFDEVESDTSATRESYQNLSRHVAQLRVQTAEFNEVEFGDKKEEYEAEASRLAYLTKEERDVTDFTSKNGGLDYFS